MFSVFSRRPTDTDMMSRCAGQKWGWRKVPKEERMYEGWTRRFLQIRPLRRLGDFWGVSLPWRWVTPSLCLYIFPTPLSRRLIVCAKQRRWRGSMLCRDKMRVPHLPKQRREQSLCRGSLCGQLPVRSNLSMNRRHVLLYTKTANDDYLIVTEPSAFPLP